MSTKIKITPEMIRVSRILLRRLEQLGRLIEEQDKEFGHVLAIRRSEDMDSLRVAIFDSDLEAPRKGYYIQEIDIEGNVTVGVQELGITGEPEEPEEDKEDKEVDLFGGSGINWFEED